MDRCLVLALTLLLLGYLLGLVHGIQYPWW